MELNLGTNHTLLYLEALKNLGLYLNCIEKVNYAQDEEDKMKCWENITLTPSYVVCIKYILILVQSPFSTAQKIKANHIRTE